MISILLDTSNTNLTIGFAKDHILFAKTSYESWQRQSEFLVEEINKLLESNSLQPKDINEVIVSKGPGSYTGVRIAMTVGKVMAFALNVPLYLVSSLEVYKAKEGRSVCLMNARSKRSYVGVYEGNEIILSDTIMDNEQIRMYLAAHPEYKVCGDVAYLGLEGEKTDILENLKDADIERNLIKDVLSAKPVYLKDL